MIKHTGYENKENDHWDNFYMNASTSSKSQFAGKCMETSQKNLHVDIGVIPV